MTDQTAHLNDRYTSAASSWSDKMRVLGYYDGYLGFLSHLPREDHGTDHVIDAGCGTGAMAEAFVAVNGAPASMTLLDPAEGMLNTAKGALSAREVKPIAQLAPLDAETRGSFDVILAAHVIEHFGDPAEALSHLRRISRTGARLWLVVSKPHWCSVLIWLKWRHRTFQQQEISEMLSASGFETEHFYSFPSGPPSRTSFGVVARAI